MKLLFITLLSVSLFSCSNLVSEQQKLNIAVAANMKVAMDSIVPIFNAKTGINCQLYTNASGTLCSQIEQGAPYGIFVSADNSYPRYLFEKGLANKPKVYGLGTLVLVLRPEVNIQALDQTLLSSEVKKIALAFPDNAPYGKAGEEVLINLGLKERLQSKVVIGESVGQVNQLFASNAVDAAFTSYSFLKSYQKPVNYIEIEQSLYSEIRQSAVSIISENNEAENSRDKFMNFLTTNECLRILDFYGYRQHK
ncbi:MAG: molybdate ABC transporter substrate-binding protein [Flavobacteriales bacterium]|jgi:molybdate transport system substrate-binding protein|nr:molybdate ABC transporter substrate-binding protein [Flavobacteriales bacterium]